MQFRSKERRTRVKDRAKNGASKQRAGRGRGRKEGNACRQTPGFWKPPTWPLMPELAHRHLMLSSNLFPRAFPLKKWVPFFKGKTLGTRLAVISCHNWPMKCLPFRGAEINFRGRVCETKIIFFVFWNAWRAFMVKSQWIRTINAGFVHLSF